MSAETEQKDIYGKVLKKIGRNLLLFQQAEGLIKRLVTLGSLSTRAGESLKEFEQRASFCHKMTMGQVANLYLERISTPQPPVADSPCAATTHPHSGIHSIAVKLQLEIGADPDERRQSFDRLVAQRNELVHQIFSRINPDSSESCVGISDELDEQRRQILPEIQRLQQDLRDARSILQKLDKFLDVSELQSELCLPEIQQSPLIRNLASLAEKNPEPEDWTQLGEATKQLKGFPHEKIRVHLDQFQQKSLTALLIASRLFEIRSEPSESGHDRMFYRLKSALTSPSKADSAGNSSPFQPPRV